MRVYEFRCKECSKVYEDKDRFAQIPCCDMVANRIYNIGGVAFKGSGWHSKDYK